MFIAILKTFVNDYELSDQFEIISAGLDYPTVRKESMDIFIEKVFKKNGSIAPFEFKNIAAMNTRNYKSYDIMFINFHNLNKIPFDERSISLMYPQYRREHVYQDDSRISVISEAFIKEAFEKAFNQLYKEKGLTPKKEDMHGLFNALWNDPENGYDKYYE